MKTQHIIWFLIGMGLLAAVSSCKPKTPVIEGYTPGESHEIIAARDIDSCLNIYITYTRAAGILNKDVSSTESPSCEQELANRVQIQYLDSAAKYKSIADRLISTGD